MHYKKHVYWKRKRPFYDRERNFENVGTKSSEDGKEIQTRNEGVLGKHTTIGREEKISKENGQSSRYNRPQGHTQTNKRTNAFSIPMILDLHFIFFFTHSLTIIIPFHQTVNCFLFLSLSLPQSINLNSSLLFSAPFQSPFSSPVSFSFFLFFFGLLWFWVFSLLSVLLLIVGFWCMGLDECWELKRPLYRTVDSSPFLSFSLPQSINLNSSLLFSAPFQSPFSSPVSFSFFFLFLWVALIFGVYLGVSTVVDRWILVYGFGWVLGIEKKCGIWSSVLFYFYNHGRFSFFSSFHFHLVFLATERSISGKEQSFEYFALFQWLIFEIVCVLLSFLLFIWL